MDFITAWVNQYGYWVLFIALVLELLALPLPGEVLMSYSGFLVSQGKLNWPVSIIIAAMGTSFGMTISYWLGFKLGTPFFQKYGHLVHMGPERLEKVSRWFEKYGNRMLLVSYFIPGVRHITGYFSGITRISFRTYAIYAYLGAFIWTGTFISLGKVLGQKWGRFHSAITKYLIIFGLIAAVVLLFVYIYKNYRQQILDKAVMLFGKMLKTFNSLRRVQVIVVGAAASFLFFFGLMVGLIQDCLGNEFTQFNEITLFLVHLIFKEEWSPWMLQYNYLASFQLLLTVTGLVLVWIMVRSRDRMPEVYFLCLVIIGGSVLDYMLKLVFHFLGSHYFSAQNLMGIFPGEQSFMTLTVYGSAAYLLVLHCKSVWVRILVPTVAIIILLVVGLSSVFLNLQAPSNVAAGYVFGGVWLSLNIMLLESFRIYSNSMIVVENKS